MAQDSAWRSSSDPYSLEALRLLARTSDTESGWAVRPGNLWSYLTRGRCRALDTFQTQGRCYCILESVRPYRSSRPEGRVLDARTLRIVTGILAGSSEKALSIELGISASSVAGALKRALGSFGLGSRVSCIPIMLFVALADARGELDANRRMARLSSVRWGRRRLFVLSIARPDLGFGGRLSAAECEVLGHLVEGLTYAQIAAHRKRSVRTVANQVSAVFKKLHISSRSGLLARMVGFQAPRFEGLALLEVAEQASASWHDDRARLGSKYVDLEAASARHRAETSSAPRTVKSTAERPLEPSAASG